MPELIRITEPQLMFGYSQLLEDPRDGLTLFGPLDEGKPYGIRSGIIGTRDGIRSMRDWLRRIGRPISGAQPDSAHPLFPGFEAVFGIPWSPDPPIVIEVPPREIERSVCLDDRHQRVYRTVDVYARRILEAARDEATTVDIWLVVVPEDVYRYCRPRAQVEQGRRVPASSKLSPRYARSLAGRLPLFPEEREQAIPYQHDPDFHNQLKARLLPYTMTTQIVRETTVADRGPGDGGGRPRRLLEHESDIAWKLSTGVFYKTGGRPWKIGHVRRGVCYVGLVFKQDEGATDPRSACCAAQMFLDSGDGVVFKGAVGPWYNPKRGCFHLTTKAAKELVQMAVGSYKEKTGEPPAELFLHGRVRFDDDEEWRGFVEGVGSATNLVGVRIITASNLRLYRQGRYPVLRGLAYIQDGRMAYLWTKGFIPRLQTYPGSEVPRPLLVEVSRGEAATETVLADILALTKLNYNTCIFADGQPVTLRFANAVGEILTAAPLKEVPPLAFRYYI